MSEVKFENTHALNLPAARKGYQDDAGTVLDAGSLAETLASRFNPAANNFDAVRLLLAVVVVFCHCFSLSGITRDPIDAALRLGYGGTLAVDGFLVISGFLVTRSFLERSLDEYVVSRLLRILPGLAIVTLAEVFAVGAAFTHNDLWTYLTYVGFRHLWNVLVFGLDAQIYGVFAHTDPPWMMNGSLWTIPIECSFYIILPLVALAGLRRAAVPLFVASIAAQPVLAHFGLGDVSLFTNVHAAPFADLASYFLAGAVAWVERERIPFSPGALALCLIGLYAAAGVALNDIALKLFLPYIVLYVSLAGGIGSRLKHRIGDLSYGAYLFGFPVTLSVIEVTGGLPPYRLFATVIVATLACAWASWRWVERPCLRWRVSRPPSASGRTATKPST